MRNTTRTIAALATVAASLAFGVSQASALTWSSTDDAIATGSLTFSADPTYDHDWDSLSGDEDEYTVTCPGVVLGLALGGGSNASWHIQGEAQLNCYDPFWETETSTTIGNWYLGDTELVGGNPVMTMNPSPSSYWSAPFAWSYYTNVSPGTVTLDVINGDSTTPTKIVFDRDKVGDLADRGGGGLYATGELELVDGWTGGLITLN